MTEYVKLIKYSDEASNPGIGLTLHNLSDETAEFSIVKVGNPTVTPNLQWTQNDVWSNYDFTELPTVQVPAGGKITFIGTNSGVFSNSDSNYYKFHMNKSYEISGNLMSIYDYISQADVTSLPRDSMFRCLFRDETNLIDAKKANIGKVTNASRHNSFQATFRGCTYLRSAMNLSSITGSNAQQVFGQTYMDCSSLTDPGEYNAQHATNYTWYRCFMNCTSLKKASDLSCIKQWGDMGISEMFSGDTALETPPSFSTNTSWGGQPIGESIFYNCSNLVSGPDWRCFQGTGYFRANNCFDGCTKLKTIYFPNLTGSASLSNWVRNVPSTGTLYIPYGLEIPYVSNLSNWTRIYY